MANNHYKHKDYSNLLRELQKKSKANKVDVVDEISTTEPEEVVEESSSSSKEVSVDYDLDSLLDSVNNFGELITLYKYCEEMVETEQQITQDLLHAIEFSDDYKERYKLSTQLHYNRKRRRQYKNAIAVLKPLVDFLNKEENKKCLNKLSNILGDARKAKQHETDKVYSPRILTTLGVLKNEKWVYKKTAWWGN